MQFDHLAPQYNSILDRVLRVSGEGWEYFAVYKGRYTARHLKSNFKGKILDFGCGIGNNSVQLKRYLPLATVHGCDSSQESLKKVPAALLAQGKFSSNLDSLDRDYDLIFVANVLHHIDPAPRKDLISQLLGHLKEGGRILVIEHNPWNPLTRWNVRHSPIDVDAQMLNLYEAKSLMKAASLQIDKCDYIVFFFFIFSIFRSLEPLLVWCPLGAQFAVWGKKTSKNS